MTDSQMTDEDRTREARGQMLPGIAGICLFMIAMTIVNVYAALTGVYGAGASKYAMLGVCTLLAAGVVGLMRLRKWGWALVTAGSLLIAAGYFFLFAKGHVGFLLVQGLFGMVFFFYLVRPETRERLL